MKLDADLRRPATHTFIPNDGEQRGLDTHPTDLDQAETRSPAQGHRRAPDRLALQRKIMMIQRHIFRADVIGGIDVFKIPNLRVSPTFLSHRFVDRWKASGSKGLEFKQVWAPPN